MPVDPVLAPLLAQLSAPGVPRLHELAPAEARAAYAQMQRARPGLPIARVEERTLPGPAGDLTVRVYRPREGLLPGLLWFHGGGWVIGDLDTHDALCRELANRAECAVVSVDYRLAPEHRHPAAFEDCLAATRYVAENAARLAIDPERLGVGGDSAGGNLAAAVALAVRDAGGPSLCHQLLVVPITDADFERTSYRENADGYLLTRDAMRWFWDHYLPDPGMRRDPTAAPLHGKSLRGLPPAHVITAEFDPLRDEGEAYAARLAEAGVPVVSRCYPGMIHQFFGMTALLEGAREAMAEATTILRRAFDVESLPG